MDLIEKYKEIMKLAEKSKVEFYTLGQTQKMPIMAQKKPIEEVGLIITNLMILEKLEEISNKLTPSKEEIEITGKEIIPEVVLNEEKNKEPIKEELEIKKAGRPPSKKE